MGKGVDQITFKAAIDWYKEHMDYNDAQNKPTINGETVEGDKTSDDYNIQPSVVITGLAMTVTGKNVTFHSASSQEETLKATLVSGTNIRFVR